MFNRRRFLGLSVRKWQYEPWNDFVRGLLTCMGGNLTPLPDTPDGYPQARFSAVSFKPQRLPAVFRLARDYDVAVCPEHPELEYRLIGRPGLYLDAGRNSGQVEILSETAGLVSSACPVAALQQAGYGQFERVPGDMTIAQWLADPRWHDQRTGQAALSGVERVEGCCTSGRLILLQRPQDTAGTALAAGLTQSDWDDLQASAGSEKASQAGEESISLYCSECFFEDDQGTCRERNFAEVSIGALGTLIWPTRVVIRKAEGRLLQRPPKEQITERTATDFDRCIKSVYDPDSVLPYWDEVLLK